MGRTCVGAAWVMMAALASAASAGAGVERVEVTEHSAFAPGVSFGDQGQYEKIRGVAWFALDPDAPANARIVDLKLAPRDRRGRVVFKSEFVLLRPVAPRPSTLL